jgi:hypothetical protein
MAFGGRLRVLTITAGLACTAAAAQAQTRPPAPATPPAQTPARPPQTPAPRPPARPATAPKRSVGFLTFGGGAQITSSDFSETHSEPLYGEQKTWTADYEVKTGLAFEAGGGYRVWRDLFVGGSYTYFHDSRAAGITAQIPHPFFFNQPRTVTGDSASLSHDEHAGHISVFWVVPASRRLEIAVFGGPSIIGVSRPLVENVEFTQTYPYDTAEFSRAPVKDASKTGFGAHGGASVSYLVTPQVGVGGSVRYSRAGVDLPSPSGGSVSFNPGGLQATATVTVRFLAKAPAPRVPPRPIPPRPAPGTGSRTTDVPVAGVIATAVTTATTPIFLRADATLTPLRQVRAGTRLRVLDEGGDWVHVEFDDPQYGRRVGYVQRALVRIEGGR